MANPDLHSGDAPLPSGMKPLTLPLLQQIDRAGQTLILRFWNQLSTDEKQVFADQLERVDWPSIRVRRKQCLRPSDESVPKPLHVEPPRRVIRRPQSASEWVDWEAARNEGLQLLRRGKVGVLLVAGGSGTRLGFHHPKGMYPIGPVTNRSLFQLFAEQVLALTRRHQTSIPFMIMTGESTHQETVDWFEKHDWFGLTPADVFFFQQGWEPILHAVTGELLLAEKGKLATSADGHGGMLAAMVHSKLFEELQRRSIKTLFYHQVDNPLVNICDPVFLGFHARDSAQVSTKVVAKASPDERVGVVVEIDNRVQIIEYIDLPVDLAVARDPDGQLRIRAGNTAIHVFECEFLEQVARSHSGLPWHPVRRPVPFLDSGGSTIRPDHSNALKFERFIFDVLPMAKTALVFETDRKREFAPLKNADGNDSPTEVRRAMTNVAAEKLRSAGIQVPDGIEIEISPLAILSDDTPILRQGVSLPTGQSWILTQEHLIPAALPQSSHEISISTTPETKLGPLRFEPRLVPRVWGGRALHEFFGHALATNEPYGEAWDISALPDGVSSVVSGPLHGMTLTDLWTDCRRDLVGTQNSVNGHFPLLIKWLECRDLLSLQVHPNDTMARQVLNQPFGKSEAWIVLEADPTAKIMAGFRPGVSRADFLKHLELGTPEECIHTFTPRVGDCILLPAGTVHAAGGGLLIAEVQQSSDATFRLHDWNRLGLDGRPRPLQIEQALQAIDWTQGAIEPVRPRIATIDDGISEESLADFHAFSLNRYTITRPWVAAHPGELTVWMVLEGSGIVSHSGVAECHALSRGRSLLIPASAGEVVWSPKSEGQALKLLSVRIPNS